MPNDYIEIQTTAGPKRLPLLHDPKFPTKYRAPGSEDTPWSGIVTNLAQVMGKPFQYAEEYLARQRYDRGDLLAVADAEQIIRFGAGERYKPEPLGWSLCKPDWYTNRGYQGRDLLDKRDF